MYRQLKLCSSQGAYEAIPEPPRPLDLGRVRATLARDGVPVIDARVMLIVGSDPETTISRNGKILVKTRDPALAQRTFERLAGTLGLPWEAPATSERRSR
ncbi:MAG TPA: hypothetical protein VMG99_04710 [Thermoplasmata archaeon]|jgi:hypothetical protein|nr:hypothetical protein [Thermoplasmata archaeon]